MHSLTLLALPLLASAHILPPTLFTRQSTACFIVGTETLPKEVADVATAIAGDVTCAAAATTLDNVPDVTSGGVTFSDVDFSASTLSPLAFALQEFATADPVADTDLQRIQDSRSSPWLSRTLA